jgi:DNA-directed RNA polymerase specialized sigma24 family protein
MLYYYDDLTYRELGVLLGVSAATVNARLTRARSILRQKMAPCRAPS